MWDFTGSRSSRVQAALDGYSAERADLAPAQWIWLPSQRTLPNTVVLFRHRFEVVGTSASGRLELSAESRYRLWLNGTYLGFGPAPSDPRWPDVDTVDLTEALVEGPNSLVIEVLYYGHGDGTWVMGKPGLIARGEVSGDRTVRIASGPHWECRVDRARTPVRPKRWYLRALQEVYDARRSAHGWFSGVEDPAALPAMVLDAPADRPCLVSSYPDYLAESSAQKPESCFLRRRQIPPMDATELVDARRLYANRVRWSGDPEDWFDYRVPGLFEIGPEIELPPSPEPDSPQAGAAPAESGATAIPADALADPQSDAVIVTYDLGRQVVGWPYFEIDAPPETVIEISLQEGHDPRKTRWLDTHLFRWIRYVCSGGPARFEAFDYDSVRYLQLHIRGASGPVSVRRVGVRRRRYRFASPLSVTTSDRALQRLFTACANTLDNAVHETLVDCMGRERQQYAGDVSHEMPRFLITAYDEYRHPRRYLRTFSEGMTTLGFFLDSWPGVDRTVRIPQRMLGLTSWGPILDHSVGFVFDCYNYYFHSGDLESIAEVYPAVCAFIEYLTKALPYTDVFSVENLGIPTVWIDHDAYERQRHKQCAYNLYIVAMLRHAFAPLAEAIGDDQHARGALAMARRVLEATTKRFWSDEHEAFVANLPWLLEEDSTRLCDRSLATALLYDLCPRNKTERSLQYLVEMPPVVGRSYVPNQKWRHQALGKMGRCDVLLKEYRGVWAKMKSVTDNQTVSELWTVRPDSASQYSHIGAVPLMILFSEIAGIKPTAVGYTEYEVHPQLGDLKSLDLTYHTPFGPIRFESRLRGASHHVTIRTPPGASGVMRLAGDASADASLLPETFLEERPGKTVYSLPADDEVEVDIPAILGS